MQVIKRDLSIVGFTKERIAIALKKAGTEAQTAEQIARKVEEFFLISGDDAVKIDDVQTVVLKYLVHEGLIEIHDKYLAYMLERNQIRKSGGHLVNELGTIVDNSSESMKENANVNSQAPMGKMLKIGSAASKKIYLHLMPKDFSKAHEYGDIHIHDLEFHDLTTTCCQIDLNKLFKNGFGTGHGRLREPQRIGSYASLACIALQSNQNDQHGGQSIPCLDYYLAPGVTKTYRKTFRDILYNDLCVADMAAGNHVVCNMNRNDLIDVHDLELNENPPSMDDERILAIRKNTSSISHSTFFMILKKAHEKALQQTDDDTFQAMEAIVHNLNTMHSRAGAQVPFSSVNYGTDTSLAGRMVIKNILLALDNGMGNSETPIFPIHIFKVKSSVNYEPGTPNHDLFKLACSVTSRRLFPNFSFLDVPYNLQYYKQGKPETEVVYMGCRTRVIGNVHDPSREVVTGRGNLNYTSINLPRLAIQAEGKIDKFNESLNTILDLVSRQLLHRLETVSQLKVKNFPFLMGQGVWIDSEHLKPEDTIGEILKHGTLSIGFIGLAEALVSLTGEHHGQSQSAQKLGLDIISRMRSYCDAMSEKHKLNFTLISTPAEGLSGRFLQMDRERYGIIPGVTDHDYYTNGFHVPVYFDISIVDKISIEAPYHELCNAGHISYVELDGAVHNNAEAVEDIVKIMYEKGIGYGGINHPIDHDTVCGYNGVIGDTCPQCGRAEGDVPFQRIRRITGYLVGTLDRFNKSKVAEVNERVKHVHGIASETNN